MGSGSRGGAEPARHARPYRAGWQRPAAGSCGVGRARGGGRCTQSRGQAGVAGSLPVTGIPATPLPAARSQMRVTRQFETLDGQPLDLDHLKQNTVFVLVLEGEAKNGQAHRAMVQHGLPAGWEITRKVGRRRCAGHGVAWQAVRSRGTAGRGRSLRRSGGADHEEPIQLAVPAARGDARNVRAARRGSGRHVQPRGVRPTGGRPDHHRGRRVSTRSACSPLPRGRGLGGGDTRTASTLPPTSPARGGEYRSCPPCPPSWPFPLRLPRTRRHRRPARLRLPSRPLAPLLHRQRSPRPPGPPAGTPTGRGWRLALSLGHSAAAAHRPADRRRGSPLWHHPGVDPIALARAAAQLLRSGHIVSGGSTLAMQAARLLHTRPRTLRSKLIEIARALQLEARSGRRGVLDIWLTLAPFGGNLEGACAGSLAWFGVSPEALEPSQAALLVAIPRRPEHLRPDHHAAAATVIRDRVLAVGLRADLFDASPAPTPVPIARIPAAPPRAATRGASCLTCRGCTRRWTCRCRLHSSAWDGSVWKPCHNRPRSPCWWPMRPRARSVRSTRVHDGQIPCWRR